MSRKRLNEVVLDEVLTHVADGGVQVSPLEAGESLEDLVAGDGGGGGNGLGALGLLAGNLAGGDVVRSEDVVHVLVGEGV